MILQMTAKITCGQIKNGRRCKEWFEYSEDLESCSIEEFARKAFEVCEKEGWKIAGFGNNAELCPKHNRPF